MALYYIDKKHRRCWPRPQNTHFSHPPIPRDYSLQALSDTVYPSVENKQSAWKTSDKWVLLEFLKYLFNGLRSKVEPQRIWNSHIILHPSWLYYWSFRLKWDFSLNCTGIQNCRWRHVRQIKKIMCFSSPPSPIFQDLEIFLLFFLFAP